MKENYTGPYTVLVRNELLGRAHYTGNFPSYGEAETYAKGQADRTRHFATYQVHRGTPKRPLDAVGPEFRGKQ